MNPVILIACACAPGEYMLQNCTATQPAVCWPSEPGFASLNGIKAACAPGSWSGSGMSACVPCTAQCGPRQMRARDCSATTDILCVPCPAGFGCNQSAAEPCRAGTYSNRSECIACPEHQTSKERSTSLEDCVCLRPGCNAGCGPNEMVINGRCLLCPPGFTCKGVTASPCPPNTYSWNGLCVSCDPNARSPGRSTAAEQCVCLPGYVKTHGDKCTACKSGTVWNSSHCVLCDAGHFCVGKLHRDRCPLDSFSHRGSAMCTDCRPFSGCSALCTDAANCSCDPGYVDMDGECKRCPPGTQKKGDRCVPCDPGFACAGGADITACGLALFSEGGRSTCRRCTDCNEVMVARCNQTHDSTCANTTAPLAVVKVFQEFKTEIDGELFSMFIHIMASSLPKCRILRICGGKECLRCFQGVCPSRPRLYGPEFSSVIELRFDGHRMAHNMEALRSHFLLETAKTTMHKLTNMPFVVFSRIQEDVICPNGLTWDPVSAECFLLPEVSAARTWAGLVFAICLVSTLSACSVKREQRWIRVPTY